MRDIDDREVNEAVTEMVRILGPQDTEDWSVPAGSLEWSCWTTAAHIAHDLLAYAGQVAARPMDAYLPFDLAVRPDSSPREVLQVVVACAGLLGGVLATAGPEVRAWHWGPGDPSGFAAMGVAEILLHTNDIAQGLGVGWLPPAPLCAAVLHRLFPDAPAGDPVRVLLWCTGRGELDGHSRRTEWKWRAAVAIPTSGDSQDIAAVDHDRDCFSCRHTADLLNLPLRERIAFDDHWRVAHAFGSAVPGWLVLVPRRHVTAIGELSDAEAVGLGVWQVRLSRALHAVVGCAKTYVVQFAEAEGFGHVHFHVIPRMADLAAAQRGPGVFQLLGGAKADSVPADRVDEIARLLRTHLEG